VSGTLPAGRLTSNLTVMPQFVHSHTSDCTVPLRRHTRSGEGQSDSAPPKARSTRVVDSGSRVRIERDRARTRRALITLCTDSVASVRSLTGVVANGAMLSKMAISLLGNLGFDDVADLIDGYQAWATR
jgi:hypothetical protein